MEKVLFEDVCTVITDRAKEYEAVTGRRYTFFGALYYVRGYYPEADIDTVLTAIDFLLEQRVIIRDQY